HDPIVADPDGHRSPAEVAPPGGTAAADPRDARHLEGGQADELGDDALADGQLRAAHDASSTTAGGRACPSDAAIRPGTPVRASGEATSRAKPIIRGFARP